MIRATALLLACIAMPSLAAGPIALFEMDPAKIRAKWRDESLEAIAGDRDPKARAKAAESLGGDKGADAVEALARALGDRDARVRQAAASALWKTEKAAEGARPRLVAALDDTDPNVVARVAGALQAMGMKSADLVPARQRVFNASDATLDSRFLVARNLVGQEPATALLVPMIEYLERNAAAPKDSGRHNVELAQKALERLVKSRDGSIAAPLLEATRNARAGQVVLLKSAAMLEPRPAGYLDLVLAMLDAKDRRVREAALYSLRSMKDERDVARWMPKAAAMLGDAEPGVRMEALWAMGSQGGLAASEVEAVAARLADPDRGVRLTAASAIGDIGAAKQAIPAATMARVAQVAKPALEAALGDADGGVRDAAKAALAKIGDAPAMAPSNVATAAVASPASESDGMALLRARRIAFEESSYFRALTEGDVDVVRAFLDAGMSAKAPVMAMGGPTRVMLFGSATACNAGVRPTSARTREMLKLLLERGADPDGADAQGNTALMEAAAKGCDRETIRMLVRAGGKVTAKNAAGLTPFEVGLWSGHDGLEELLAAGYRLPPDKVKAYAEGYKDRPAALAMIRKAAAKK